MPFAYYHRLTRRQQGIYRRSDQVDSIRLSDAADLAPVADGLANALTDEDPKRVKRLCDDLANGICNNLDTPRVRIKVLARRPSDSSSELHGLYQPAEAGRTAEITVWMRTAQRRQVVAFRTFLRTLLHELCHHLDYELLRLEDTFHTEGFYKRESSLFYQLVPKKKHNQPAKTIKALPVDY